MRLLLFIPLLLISCQANRPQTSKKIRFYTGTTDGSIEKSIVLCELDVSSGAVTRTDSFGGSKAPSYLALSPDKQFLYSVDNEYTEEGWESQQVSAFEVDRETGSLEFLNSQPSEGTVPCHISVHPGGKFIFTANYSSGTIAVHPLNEDGSIAPASDVRQHEGSGPDSSRQKAAHAHFICANPQGNFVLAIDLGIDKVMNYAFDQQTGKLSPNPAQEYFSTAPGAGPRHLVFNQSGTKLFLLNELNGSLTACDYDPVKGIISEINTLATLGEDFSGNNKSAAVRVHPEGKYVYASNRGDRNSITAFSILEDGAIESVQVQDQDINWPRDFNIDPSGHYMLVENQHGNSIVVFEIDPESGMLEPAGQELIISQPTCIVFLDE